MSRCSICGSNSDCDEFCGNDFSQMRDLVLEARDELENLQSEKQALQRKLDLAAEALSYVINYSGTSTDYNKKCIQALKEIKEME